MAKVVNFISNIGVLSGSIIGTIAILFVMGVLINLTLKRKYQDQFDDLRNGRISGSFSSSYILSVIKYFKSSADGAFGEVNTPAIIETIFEEVHPKLKKHETFLDHVNTIAITLGVLGTFIGLIIVVGNISEIFSSMSIDEIMDSAGEGFFGGLKVSLDGMSVAFVTSLAGILASIGLTIMMTFGDARKMRISLMLQLEEYLDNVIAKELASDKKTEYTLLNSMLRETFLEFGDKISDSLDQTVKGFSRKLSQVVVDVNTSADGLDRMIGRFDTTLTFFADNMKDLGGFNEELSLNVANMDTNFTNLSVSLDSASESFNANYEFINSFGNKLDQTATVLLEGNKVIATTIDVAMQKSSLALDEFSKSISSMVSTIEFTRKDSLDEMKKFAPEIEETVSAIEMLAFNMQKYTKENNDGIDVYQKEMNVFVKDIKSNISVIGEQLVDSIADTINEKNMAFVKNCNTESLDSLNSTLNVLKTYKENEKGMQEMMDTILKEVIDLKKTSGAGLNQTEMSTHKKEIK